MAGSPSVPLPLQTECSTATVAANSPSPCIESSQRLASGPINRMCQSPHPPPPIGSTPLGLARYQIFRPAQPGTSPAASCTSVSQLSSRVLDNVLMQTARGRPGERAEICRVPSPLVAICLGSGLGRGVKWGGVCAAFVRACVRVRPPCHPPLVAGPPCYIQPSISSSIPSRYGVDGVPSRRWNASRIPGITLT